MSIYHHLYCAVIDLNDTAFVICLIENEDFHLDVTMANGSTPFSIYICMYVRCTRMYVCIQSPAFFDRILGIQECDLCISHYSVWGAKHDDKIKVSCFV